MLPWFSLTGSVLIGAPLASFTTHSTVQYSTVAVDTYVFTYVNTYVPDSTGREGCFRSTKQLIKFSLAVTSHVNACTFIHLVYSHVCFCITSDVLVPTCSFRRARSDVLVPMCSFRCARSDVLVPTCSCCDDYGTLFPVHLLP